MAAILKSYPVYTLDEPITYNRFDGGINTDPNTENLVENEVSDCINMTYAGTSLTKRKGFMPYTKFICEDDLNNIQGIFLFTRVLTHIVVANNGKLYAGIFNESSIELTKLPILVTQDTSIYENNPVDILAGLEVSMEIQKRKHSGYVYQQTGLDYYANIFSDNYMPPQDLIEVILNRTTVSADVYANYFSSERLYTFENSYFKPIESKYSNTFDTITRYNVNYWKRLGNSDDEIAQILQSIPTEYRLITAETYVEDETAYILLNGYYTAASVFFTTDGTIAGSYYQRKPIIEESLLTEYIQNASEWDVKGPNSTGIYYSGTIIKEDNSDSSEPNVYWICLKTHYTVTTLNRYIVSGLKVLQNPDYMTKFFTKVDVVNELVFQNKFKVEATTFRDALYIATGTRFIKVEATQTGEGLIANVITPHLAENTEIIYRGFNYLSPYPEYCRKTTYDHSATTISNVLVRKVKGSSTFELEPMMTFLGSETEDSYAFRWEKLVNNEWVTIISFKDNYMDISATSQYIKDIAAEYSPNKEYFDYSGGTYEPATVSKEDYSPSKYYLSISKQKLSNKRNLFNITVDDAENCIYRVTFANEFEVIASPEGSILYKDFEFKRLKADGSITSIEDWEPSKIAGQTGQAATILYAPVEVNDNFKTLHTCTKIFADGNKFLLYGDRYNSGSWFKTNVGDPTYISDRGNLSFKTKKNESLVKIIPFQNTLVVFAASETLGGSIHLVLGNGDDYNDNSGYYSPYRSSVLTSQVTCSNPDTVHVCENMIVFKYFNNVYYLAPNSGELASDNFYLYSLNDRINHATSSVHIPWEDDSCTVEITADYYGLLWKSKYSIQGDDIVLERPAMRVKLYYKTYNKIGNKYFYPWLRDESEFFNVDNLVHIKGEPLYLIDNVLYKQEGYLDNGTKYPCNIKFRAEFLGHDKIYKLVESVLLNYYRDHSEDIRVAIVSFNEAKHKLLDSENKGLSLKDITAIRNESPQVSQDTKALREGDKIDTPTRVGYGTVDTKLVTGSHSLPCLSVSTEIYATCDGVFSLASLTYAYTTIDMPKSSPFDLYSNTIKPEEI